MALLQPWHQYGDARPYDQNHHHPQKFILPHRARDEILSYRKIHHRQPDYYINPLPKRSVHQDVLGRETQKSRRYIHLEDACGVRLGAQRVVHPIDDR